MSNIMLQGSVESFGIDWDGPLSLESDDGPDCVDVPQVTNPLQPADYFELKATIDPTRPCEILDILITWTRLHLSILSCRE